MAVTYTVKRGDTLYDIGRKYGIDWNTIYSANKSRIPSVRALGVGTVLTIPTAGGSTNAATDAFKKASVEKAPKSFSEVVPWEKFLPREQIQQFSESQVNPEYSRIGEQQTNQVDWANALANTFRSGFAQKARQDVVDANERARKAALTDYVQNQTDLFSNLYGQEMSKYYDNPANYLPQYDEWIKQLLPSQA